MMHQWHTPDNPNWTPPSCNRLTPEQWENAYSDLKRKYAEAKEEIEDLRAKLGRATEWRNDFDVGC